MYGSQALAGLIVLAALWCGMRSETPSYVTAKGSVGDFLRTVGMTDSLDPVVTAQLGSSVSGNISSWSGDDNLSGAPTRESLVAQHRSVAIPAETLALERLSYGAGTATVLQVVDAERASAHAVPGSAAADAQPFEDSAALLLALGCAGSKSEAVPRGDGRAAELAVGWGTPLR